MLTSQSSQFIGSIPEHYDKGLGPHIFADYAEDIAQRAAHCKPSSVLELAAGTGIVTRKLRDNLSADTQLLATDLSLPMLDLAKTKFSEAEDVGFEVTDATSLPYAPSSFDTVVCQFGVMFFLDQLASYKEVFRVLKPGGRYIFNVWDSLAMNPFAKIIHETLAQVFPDDPPDFYNVPFGYNDREVITDSLKESGFKEVIVETLPLTLKVLSTALLAQGTVFGSPLYQEIMSREGDLATIHARIQQALASNLGDTMPTQAIVFSAG